MYNPADQQKVLALMMAVSYNEEAKNGFGFHSKVDHLEVISWSKAKLMTSSK
jgi:hypothetical protein